MLVGPKLAVPHVLMTILFETNDKSNICCKVKKILRSRENLA